MNLLEIVNSTISAFANFMWGAPLLILLLGGGIYFSLYSRFVPFKYFVHGFNILLGRYHDPKDPGEITHFQALSSALASTVGLGNISGVAIAIQMGGPGALFWMWVSAIVGMSTKFFSCTLSILYRGKDDQGNIQGGPMYYIENGLGKKFKPLSILFSAAGLIGCTVIFQSNQLAQILRDQLFVNDYRWLLYWYSDVTNLLLGLFMAIITGVVVFGGIKRIGQVASFLVPVMVILYLFSGLLVIFNHLSEIPSLFGLIIYDGYRPWFITKMFWEGTPNDLKHFVADPEMGSVHNRGCAIDIGLYNIANGEPVNMISGYDEFTEKAYPNYTGGTKKQREIRDLLISVMKKNNFSVYEYEWWHFNYVKCNSGIMNFSFDELDSINSI